MALIIEAPNEVYSVENMHNAKIFLAGGITNCPNWQKDIIEKLQIFPNITIYNPRREIYPSNDRKSVEEQITWEFKHLLEATIIIYWFSKGSVNPITLFELGRYGLSGDTPILIGIDPEYERKEDVEIQTSLSRPEVVIYDNIGDIVDKLYKVFETH